MYRSHLNIISILLITSLWAVQWYLIVLDVHRIPKPASYSPKLVPPSHKALIDAIPTFRIAIVGAGVGGSSSAFWISQALQSTDLRVAVDIYEQSSQVGGRILSSELPGAANYSSEIPVELGADSFRSSHQNVWRAIKEFHIPFVEVHEKRFRIDTVLHIWDGSKLTRISYYLKDLVDMWISYGLPYFAVGSVPSRLDEVAQRLRCVNKPGFGVWNTTASFIQRLGFVDMVSSSVEDYFTRAGMYKSALKGLLLPLVSGENNALHTLFGMGASWDSRYRIRGAHRLVEEFIARSKAPLFLNTTVIGINKVADSPRWLVNTTNGTNEYDAVIFASPFHQSNVTIPRRLSRQIPYVADDVSHVTFVTTRSLSANNSVLGFPSETVGIRLLASKPTGGEHAVIINSLRYQERVNNDVWVVKITSPNRLSDYWLWHAFNGDIGSVYRHKWTFTKQSPTIDFSPIRLDDGFYYLNGFESAVSSMETQLIASRNLVDMLLNDHFSLNICASILKPTKTSLDDFLVGWDC